MSSFNLGSLGGNDVREVGSLVHVFTHLKLTMHVYHVRLETDGKVIEGMPARKWVANDSMEGETLSTGMRRCWELVGTKT